MSLEQTCENQATPPANLIVSMLNNSRLARLRATWNMHLCFSSLSEFLNVISF